jgi:hypothetical protein
MDQETQLLLFLGQAAGSSDRTITDNDLWVFIKENATLQHLRRSGL